MTNRAGEAVEHQRRLDRVLAEGYLAELATRSTDEIRAMRDECEEEESGLSYARRLLQGKLDILRAEAIRRRDAGDPEAASILTALPDILADEQRRPMLQTRAPRFLVPPSVQYHRREVERLADDHVLTALPEQDDEQLASIVERLATKERELSLVRRALLDRLDRLQDELAKRYKSGAADVADVLARRR